MKSGEASRQTEALPVRRADYWTSVIVLVFVAAFFISIAAVCYSIIATPPPAPGVIPTMDFPWVGWFAGLLAAAAVIIGFAHYIAGKSSPDGKTNDAAEKAWAAQLPERVLRVYRIIKDAPLFMVCFALIALGATLLVIDGALGIVSGIVHALIPYAPYFIGGITVFAVAIATLMAYFRHAGKRLAAEYAFRREVMEKTGVILLDDAGRAILPPDKGSERYAIGSIKEITVGDAPPLEAEPVRALPSEESL